MKYRGRMIVAVEGASTAELRALVPALQAGLDRARREFPQVEQATVTYDKRSWLTLDILLESEREVDDTVELDDVGNSLFDRALECMNDDDSDDMTVLESALIPA